jgi:anaerobic magnesium-protoporphyrin IX monomethyl ester cyclase
MKVLLINPPGTDTRQIWPPLGLLSVSAMLRRLGHSTRIMDMLALKSSGADLEEQIRDFGPDLVGTGYTTPQSEMASEVVKTVKKFGRRIIIGGPHPTALPEASLRETGADAAYLWEIEHTIGQSIEQVAAGDLSPQMAGVAYLRDGACVTGPAGTPLIDLDELPFLDYSEIPFEIYSTRQQTIRFPRQRPMATMVSSRGCPHRCSFCMNFMGKRWRSKSAGRFLEEIDILVKNFNVRELQAYHPFSQRRTRRQG